MHQFDWARDFCDIRYGCPAAVDCSGTIQKIYMRKPEWSRVTSIHANVMDFMIRGRLTRILRHFRAQGSALTRNVSSLHRSKNLLQRAILYRHEKILLGREDCRPGPKKTICNNLMVFHWFLGCINSFGLASFVTSDMGVLLPWIAAGPSRKSI